MNKFDEYLKKKAAGEQIEIPVYARERIEQALLSLPEEETRVRHVRVIPRILAAAACIVFAVLFVLPNASVTYAKAIEKIPVIGELVRVVTIRNYFYSDGRHEMDVDVPKIENKQNNSSLNQINEDVSEWTKRLVDQFYADLEESGNSGYGSVYVDYEMVTNTDRWFTLKITTFETAASSDESFKYYHIDKMTGKIVCLGDLFKDKDFSDVLEKEIQRQMKKRMAEDSNAVYWTENGEIGENFASVSADHNFYINNDGDLVIPFDKYEAAPGYMGSPEFVIDKEIIKDIERDEFADIFS